MEFSYDFEMTEENKKAIEELLKQKGVKHYVLEDKNTKEKIDLVEYKDYKELEKEKQELIDYLKEKISLQAKTIKNSKTFKSTKFQIALNMRLLCQEILSKIEKSDK